MSIVIVYGEDGAKKNAFIERLLAIPHLADYRVLDEWDDLQAIPPYTIAVTTLAPPFEHAVGALVVGVGVAKACPDCD